MKKHDEEFHLDKSTVLQESKLFNGTLNIPKFRNILTRILYLIYSSEPLSTKEATETFFSTTKLFQSQSVSLKQILYLVIKELSTVAQDIIMVTSSLSKDLSNQKIDAVKHDVLRALVKITDGIERFLKQALVDKNQSVCSAALVSAFHVVENGGTPCKDVVRRWSNEINEGVNSRGGITQYHALGLLYTIKQNDRISLLKTLQTLSKGRLRSPFASSLLIRIATQTIDDHSILLDILLENLRHRNEMVVYESARAICSLKNVSQKDLKAAVSALQLMLVNHKPVLRFAAIRTLSKLSIVNPDAVAICNNDLETVVSDSNRSISTFAITTLLKTGSEASVDRLMKQISGFVNEIADDFKVIVVDAVKTLCIKFPPKHPVMLSFLSTWLRDEGGYTFKKSIVEAVFEVAEKVKESLDICLAILCEFIEDCEFWQLSTRILYFVSVEGGKSGSEKYIRYVYNRIILENSNVKAAAVCALGRVAVENAALRDRISVLLERALDDFDDEVRDRACLFLRVISDERLCDLFKGTNEFDVDVLEDGLVEYLKSDCSKVFDITNIPIVTKEDKERLKNIQNKNKSVEYFEPEVVDVGPVISLPYLGPLEYKSAPVELSESETEYVVSCVKHVYANHIVFQFSCKNTIADVMLENVTVELANTSELQFVECIPIAELKYDTVQDCLVVYERKGVVLTSFTSCLKFLVKDCDPVTGEADEEGFTDEYVLEDLQVQTSDYTKPQRLDFSNWDAEGLEERSTMFDIGSGSVSDAYEYCKQFNLSQTPLEGSSVRGVFNMTGISAGFEVYVKCRVVVTETVAVEIKVRCASADVADLLVESV